MFIDMLNVVVLNVAKLSVVMLSAVRLSLVAPPLSPEFFQDDLELQ